MKKCYVVIEKFCGVIDQITVYEDFDDAVTYFELLINKEFYEIKREPGNEFMYAQDTADDDWDIAVYPTYCHAKGE